MPYREIHVGNEIFVTRVTSEAVTEWLEVRERNKIIGYPDRPPDVDTLLHRAWINHPHEQNMLAITASMLEKSKDLFPVYSIVDNFLGNEMKLLVTFARDRYEFRFILRDEEGNSITDLVRTFSDEDVEGAFEEHLRMFAGFPSEKQYLIGDYRDFESSEKEAELAFKELQEYYGSAKELLN